MPSLENRVAHQRDALMARGPHIRVHAARVHTRLRQPAVLISAFLGGMLIARAASALRSLPGLTAQLRHLTEELGQLDAILKRITTLAPILLHPLSPEGGGTRAAEAGRKQENAEQHPPPT